MGLLELRALLARLPPLTDSSTLNDLVQASVTGTLLGMLLLLPGLSMLVGGMKHKEQRFNRAAAGVSSVLLIISIIGTSNTTWPFPVDKLMQVHSHQPCFIKPMGRGKFPVTATSMQPVMQQCAIIVLGSR